MWRVIRGSAALPLGVAARACSITIPAAVRDQLTKSLSLVKEEAKGQTLDLTDMADACRVVTKNLQEAMKKNAVEDEKFSGKAATLSASLKAYNTRLSNLQNEARSIQSEIDTLVKMMWGTEAPPQQQRQQSSTTSATASSESHANAQAAERLRAKTPPVNTAEAQQQAAKVEKVDGEKVSSAATSSDAKDNNNNSKSNNSSSSAKPEEIEVESVEIEIEPPGSVSSKVQDMSIPEITKDLHERGVNFSDCLDAKTLRKRYQDVLDGKIATQKKPSTPAPSSSSSQTQQPPAPRKSTAHQNEDYYQQQQQRPANTTETGLAHDPYPNAMRKMVDPMKYVWQIKQELAAEKNISPDGVDLWSGRTKLEDHKRLYDYPNISSNPIEVRQKGDAPR